MPSGEFKIQKIVSKGKVSTFQRYKELVLGKTNFWYFLEYEFIIFFVSWLPGALGLFLRSELYPSIIGKVGKGVVFGRGITLRHPRKIKIGDNTIIDDGCVLDAKGAHNEGITIGRGVYIGRNTIIYCKDGDIVLEDRVNIGHNSMIFSSNKVFVGKETLIAAYFYAMSGGSYDYTSNKKVINQSGYSKGPTIIGDNCWFGGKVVVADGVSVGRNSVIGAGAVVLKDIPEYSVAVGIPAQVIKKVKTQKKE